MSSFKKIINSLINPKPKPKTRAVNSVVRPAAKNDPSYQMYRALPFKKRRMNFTDWIYKNKLGVTALVLLILVLFFSFSIVKFEVSTIELSRGFFVEVPEEVLPEETKKPEVKIEEQQMMQEMFEDVRNVASNQDSRQDEPLKDDRGTDANDLYEMAEELQNRLNRASQDYKRGVKEAADISIKRNVSKDKKDDKESQSKRKDVKVQGNVTVSYSLDGRNASYLPAPAYKCENAGKVVVNIVVNHNGDVESAVVEKTTSKSDYCLNEVAVNFAKQTRFEMGSSWPQKHRGTITYLFLAQKR